MKSKKLLKALNDQIQFEFSSAYSYLAMAAYFESQNLPGFAHWMIMQYQEETAHAMKLFGYVHDRGGQVTLQAIDQPEARFKSPLDVFEKVLAHEQEVSKSINALYELAGRENDYPTVVTLQWFITEQVEEEKTAQEVLEQVRIIGNHGVSLLMLDRQLGTRGTQH
ncbi:MAG: ferritin [Ignavibacteria bacterium]|nr:ferritin [Ignavibacteria bacterium]